MKRDVRRPLRETVEIEDQTGISAMRQSATLLWDEVSKDRIYRSEIASIFLRDGGSSF